MVMVRYVGKKLCKWCLAAVPKGRLCWCGDECVHAYFLTHDWKAIRAAVLKRDAGVCRHCRRDTLKAQRVHRDVALHAWSKVPGNRYSKNYYFANHLPAACNASNPRCDRWRVVAIKIALAYGFGPTQHAGRDWWEADHIHERIRGGRDHLDNLRTLCLRCHKIETARLARERADERRARMPLAMEASP